MYSFFNVKSHALQKFSQSRIVPVNVNHVENLRQGIDPKVHNFHWIHAVQDIHQ